MENSPENREHNPELVELKQKLVEMSDKAFESDYEDHEGREIDYIEGLKNSFNDYLMELEIVRDNMKGSGNSSTMEDLSENQLNRLLSAKKNFDRYREILP